MNFYEQVEKVVEDAGIIIEDAEKFNGAIKPVRANRNDNYFKFRRDGRELLVKSLAQKTSGSAADKIAMFYLNLQESPYDVVFVVADTTTVKMFEPLVKFFRDRRMTLDNVQIMSINDFQNFIARRE